jgi:hypothetical protein
MKTVIYLMVVAFLIGTTPVMVHAHEDTESMSNEKTVAKKMEMLTTELGLSDKQAADIKVLITEKLTKLAEANGER